MQDSSVSLQSIKKQKSEAYYAAKYTFFCILMSFFSSLFIILSWYILDSIGTFIDSPVRFYAYLSPLIIFPVSAGIVWKIAKDPSRSKPNEDIFRILSFGLLVVITGIAVVYLKKITNAGTEGDQLAVYFVLLYLLPGSIVFSKFFFRNQAKIQNFVKEKFLIKSSSITVIFFCFAVEIFLLLTAFLNYIICFVFFYLFAPFLRDAGVEGEPLSYFMSLPLLPFVIYAVWKIIHKTRDVSFLTANAVGLLAITISVFICYLIISASRHESLSSVISPIIFGGINALFYASFYWAFRPLIYQPKTANESLENAY